MVDNHRHFRVAQTYGGTAMEGLIAGTTYRNPQTGARCRLLRSYTDSTWMLWEYEMRGLKRIGRHSGYMEAAEMVEYLKDYEKGVDAVG